MGGFRPPLSLTDFKKSGLNRVKETFADIKYIHHSHTLDNFNESVKKNTIRASIGTMENTIVSNIIREVR